MKRFSTSIAVLIGLIILAGPVHANPSTTEPLQVGVSLPEFSGQTITGRSVRLSESADGKPTVLVFSFSRTAGKDSRLWNDQLAKDFSNTVSTYGIIQLESAPRFFRRLAISGIKSSMPPSVQDRTLVLYRDEELWKRRLAVKDESRAYVVVLDPSGIVCWMNSGAFSDATYTLAKNKLAALLRPRP